MRKVHLFLVLAIFLSSCRLTYNQHDVYENLMNKYFYYCEQQDSEMLSKLFLSEFSKEKESCQYVESMKVKDWQLVDETNATATLLVRFSVKYKDNQKGKWNEGDNQRNFHLIQYEKNWKIKEIKELPF